MYRVRPVDPAELGDPSIRLHPLTDREREVLAGVRDGLTNAAIGQRLGTKTPTVKNQVTSICQKLNARDRTHAVMLAIKHGILPLDERIG